MILQTGNTYLTRNGSKAFVRYNTDEMGYEPHTHPFIGYIEDNWGKRCASFTETGRYSKSGTESGYDIVSEK